MKVHELIEALKSAKQDAEIYINSGKNLFDQGILFYVESVELVGDDSVFINK